MRLLALVSLSVLVLSPALAAPCGLGQLCLLNSSATQFEPSAVVASPSGSTVYVFNDKQTTISPTLWNFTSFYELAQVAATPSATPINKVEAATRSASRVYVLTSCSLGFPGTPDNYRLFAMSDPTPSTPSVIQTDYTTNFRTALNAQLAARNAAYLKFEGLALAPDGLSLLLGVREIDPNSGAPFPVLGILRYTFATPTVLTEVYWDATTCEADSRCWGLSSLEYDSAGTLWLTMSYENGSGNGVNDVAGRLHRFDVQSLTLGPILKSFAAKPEGLAFLPDSRMVLVFDEDSNRKGAFGLTQSQDYYQILKRPR